MKRNFSNLVSKFQRDVRGGVALMAGLSFPVIFLAIGGSVDYTRAVSNTTKVQSAMDSAVLALTRKDPGTFDPQTEGEKILSAYIESSQLEVTTSNVEFKVVGDMISGTAIVDTNTFFLTFVGTPQVAGQVKSTAIPPANQPIEIALVLDVSGSMGHDLNGKSRIERMKTAVGEMFDTLDEAVPASTKLSVSLVPYSSSVNVSDFRSVLQANSISGQSLPATDDVWAAERFEAANGTDYTLSDKPPSAGQIPFVVANEMVDAKPVERMTPLSENLDVVLTNVNNLNPEGYTAGHLGMIWGMYSLSPKWDTVWPAAPAEYDHADKIIVILSDGEFNTGYAIGKGPQAYLNANLAAPGALDPIAQNQIAADAYFQDACALARMNGVTIYAVALNLDAISEAKLTTCASSSGAVYAADTAAELSNAFSDIASQLGQRRLTN